MSAPASNPEGDNNGNREPISFGSYRLSDTFKGNVGEHGKNSFTMGGVKKPKFKPVAKKAVASHRIDPSATPPISPPLVPTAPVSRQEAQPPSVERVERDVAREQSESTPNPREEGNRVTERRNERNKPQTRPPQRQRPPRFLVSGESKFFATSTIRKVNGNVMDNAFLLSRQMEGQRDAKKEENGISSDMDEDKFNDDHELPAGNNGPIRFPYIQTIDRVQSEHISWDQDDAQVTPLELLQGMSDGEFLLFALPSFLPIYPKNRDYGINEEAFYRNNETKPHEYVNNELKEVPAGKIGKMRVHESGRISMDINGYIVDMNVSIPIRYQQQVVTIDQDKLNILGDVSHRLVLTPDISNFS